MTAEQKIVRFIGTLGTELKLQGNEAKGDCPYCGKGGQHFGLNVSKKAFNCFSCGASGSYPGLLEELVGDCVLTDRDRSELARDRGLPGVAFAGWGIKRTGSWYLLPVLDARGRLTDVRRYQLGKQIVSAPGCATGLYGADRIPKADRDEPVYLAEGEWDAIAWDWLRRVAGKPGVVVGVPGASTFKRSWVSLFRGRDVFVAYDNDEAGAKGENKVAEMISGVARSIKFFRWTEDEPAAKDIRDVVREWRNGEGV